MPKMPREILLKNHSPAKSADDENHAACIVCSIGVYRFLFIKYNTVKENGCRAQRGIVKKYQQLALLLSQSITSDSISLINGC